jgi:2'-5' RNA ligase
MRLFIALNFDEEVKDALAVPQERLRSLAAGGSFSRRENLHLTLAFLGETPESRVPAIQRILRDLAVPAGAGIPELNLCRADCFRHSGKELWWIGPDREDPGLPLLLDLRKQLTEGLEREGVGYDRRAFNAHITLGREIRGLPLARTAEWKDAAPGSLVPEGGLRIALNRLSLMRSGRVNALLTYTELYSRDLAPP